MISSLRVKLRKFLGRLVALVALVIFLPGLLLVGLLLRANSDKPVLLIDELLGPGGGRLRVHRFRTTGQGTNTFRALGSVIRSVGYDVLPALWDTVCGRIGLKQFYYLARQQ